MLTVCHVNERIEMILISTTGVILQNQYNWCSFGMCDRALGKISKTTWLVCCLRVSTRFSDCCVFWNHIHSLKGNIHFGDSKFSGDFNSVSGILAIDQYRSNDCNEQ